MEVLGTKHYQNISFLPQFRDDFSGMAERFFMGEDNLASKLEMTPSENCLEGDMEFSEQQKEVYFAMRAVTAKNRARVRRDATEAFKLWPEKTVVYEFHPDFSKTLKLIKKINFMSFGLLLKIIVLINTYSVTRNGELLITYKIVRSGSL